MAEAVFSITRGAGKTGKRFVGKTGFVVGPGDPAVDVPRSKLDPQIVVDVESGELDSTPTVPLDAATGADPVQDAVNALTKVIADRDTDFDWELTPVVGASGVTELEIVVVCADKDHLNDPVNHALDGRRIQLDITAGSAEFDEVGGGQGPKIVTIKEGRGVAKLVVAAALTEAQTVAMTDVDATGLTLPADGTVNFNA